MFWLKKIGAQLFYPVPVSLFLLGCGCIFLLLTKKQKWGRGLVTVGTAILLVFSLPFVPRLGVRGIEGKIRPIHDPVEHLEGRGAAPSGEPVFVYVLGMGHKPEMDWPFTLRGNPRFWMRLVEGARLCRGLPRGQLLVSVSGEGSEAQKEQFLKLMGDFLGLKAANVRLISEARTTAHEAKLGRDIIGQKEFFLVSEGLHLRRSAEIFRSAGMRPIPAPCAIENRESGGGLGLLGYLPSSLNLTVARRVSHEFIGWLWVRYGFGGVPQVSGAEAAENMKHSRAEARKTSEENMGKNWEAAEEGF